MAASKQGLSILKPQSTPYHNCRRHRLRCDKSLPGCEKSYRRGEVCFGYGRLIRWTNIVTPHGDDHHKPLDHNLPVKQLYRYNVVHAGHASVTDNGPCFLLKDLEDPRLQDLGPGNRMYISHYDRTVCPDLVSDDRMDRGNPFRLALNLLHNFPYLREIVLATSAVHMATINRFHGTPYQRQIIDALAARGRAYRLLRQALSHLEPASKPVVVVAVVFFINFDLIDSGRGKWKTHIKAAGNLISSLQSLEDNCPPEVAQLANMVVADCSTYHILGSLFARPGDTAMSAFRTVDMVSALERAAPFSYGCAPPSILGILAQASRLSPDSSSEAVHLVGKLMAFDTRGWVYNIKGLTPLDDLELRVSMAQIYRAAACLYIILAVPNTLGLGDVMAESLLVELLRHIASVPTDHSLAKGLV